MNPTEAAFDAMWERIKAKHDAEHGAGDAERLAARDAAMLGLGVLQGGRNVPLDQFIAQAHDDKEGR